MRPVWFCGNFLPVSLAPGAPAVGLAPTVAPVATRAPAAESGDVPALAPAALAVFAAFEPQAETKPVCATSVTAIIERNVMIWCGVGLLVDCGKGFGQIHARSEPHTIDK